MMGLRPDSSVVEIGCGTGLNFRFILDALDPRRGRLTGVDFSEDMLRKAQKRIDSSQIQNVRLVQADATQLSLGEKYDAVFFAYSLTMIPDWPVALRRAYEHLKPGGRIVVLDFGTFANWGPMGAVMRTWLKLNHVTTRQPYGDEINKVCGNAEITNWIGGYYFIAVGRRSA